MKTKVHFVSYPAHLFLEWEMFHTKLYRKSKNILFLMTPPPEFQGVCEVMGKIKQSGHSTDGNTMWLMCIACCIQMSTHKHTLGICNNYCSSTAIRLQERASVLRYAYVACLVLFYIHSAPPTCFCHTVVAETCSRNTGYVI